MPARLLISARPPTTPPRFAQDGADGPIYARGAIGVPEGVLLATGQTLLPLAAGSYDVTVMQGPEYELSRHTVTIEGKNVVPLDVTLEHSVRTDGWLAADMHIHTARSFDSRVAPQVRVISEVASGIELLVPTEHSIHGDFQPEIRLLGYERRAVSVPGSEYGFSQGHLGLYPVIYDPKAGELAGAPAWQRWPWTNIDAPTYFPLMHALPGEPLIVVNHPRLAPDLGYFRNLGWPRMPGEHLGTAPLFDGMEVLSGYENAPSETTPLLRDWFSLLNDGQRITALGNSDTHRTDWLRAGYPRSWLRLVTDDPSQVLPADLRGAIRGMRAIASNGPWVHMTVDGQEIGDTVKPQGGVVHVRVTADAAGWIDLSRLQIYLNGALLIEVPITGRGHPALVEEIDVPVTTDGWIVAVALGEQPLPVAVIGEVKDGTSRPIAFTNPVWLDADGDGRIRQPQGPAPRPQPWGKTDDAKISAADLIFAPLEAPLDCEPQAWMESLRR